MVAHELETIHIARLADLPAIVAIYNQAITAGVPLADTAPVSVESRQKWFISHEPTRHPIYVWKESGELRAWCSLCPYREGRRPLRFTTELNCFVRADSRRKGIATSLIAHCVNASASLRIKTLVSVIVEHNTPASALLEKTGFEKWGFLPRVTEFNGHEYGHIYYGRGSTT